MSEAEQLPFIDLHAHYAMQRPFPPRSTGDVGKDKQYRALLKVANRLGNFELFKGPRTKLKLAQAGGVSAFGSVLYDPADEFCGPNQPYENLQAQRDEVERSLPEWAVVARTPQALEEVIAEGKKIALFHCIEGGFALDGNIDKVATLAEQGVAYVILAHLFYRKIATCANGFPCLTDTSFNDLFCQPDVGLTAAGKDLCRALFEHRVIADLTHASGPAIKDILDIADEFPGQPVIASHTGVRDTSSAEYKINLDDDTIRKIHDRGGLIGVIFFDHWLRPPGSKETGIHLVTGAINHIKSITGSYECIGIGTDFEGFIHPVEGLENFSRIGDLKKRLVKDYGTDTAHDILWKNAIRVFKKGWGRR